MEIPKKSFKNTLKIITTRVGMVLQGKNEFPLHYVDKALGFLFIYYNILCNISNNLIFFFQIIIP